MLSQYGILPVVTRYARPRPMGPDHWLANRCEPAEASVKTRRIYQDEVERIRFSPRHVSVFTDFRVLRSSHGRPN